MTIPLFISRVRLDLRKRLPRASAPWAMDSGGFTALDKPPHRWVLTADDYVEIVERYATEIGGMEWAAPQDWMCEPWIIEKTGLSVREHQERTVQNYLDLRGRGPFVPVLQGWTLDDYEACVDLYAQAGIDLTQEPLVGVGSVCRRQATGEIAEIMLALAAHGLSLHGFGVKKAGIDTYGEYMTSADSMAWSYRARRSWPLPDCTHKSCANCPRYALRWRDEILARRSWPTLFEDSASTRKQQP